jgi:hypothetical protein
MDRLFSEETTMPASMKHVISVPWTDEERTTLRRMWENGMGVTLLGRMLGRSKYSVRSEIDTLKLGPRGSVVAPPERPPGRVVLARAQPKPLPANARTLPPLPSEMHADER